MLRYNIEYEERKVGVDVMDDIEKICKIEGVKFSLSMGKIFFDKNQICIIVLSKFLVFCCRIIYLIIVLPIRLRLYMNFIIFCSTNNGISNPSSWALPTPGLGNKLGFSGNTINAEGIRGRQELDVFTSTPVFCLQVCCQSFIV